MLKSRSPSCGVGSAPHRDTDGVERTRGDGVFAAAVARELPGLPIVDDGQLATPEDCRGFLERVCSHAGR